MKKTVVFDLDGTLLNTLDDLSDAVNTALAQYAYPARKTDEIASFLGRGYGWLIDHALPANAKADERESVLATFQEQYAAHCMDKTRPYDGILELLDALVARGCHLAIVSNKGDAEVRELAKKYFPSIPVAVGEKAGVRKKPAPDTALAALRALGADARDAVYVGDSEVDVETAKNAGLPCISVSWGFRPRSLLETLDAAAVIDRPEEIPPLLNRL